MEKAAVPELYRQAMFEPEFLTTVCFYLFIYLFWGGGYRVSSRSTTYMLQENTGCATIWNTRRMVPKNTSLLIGLSPYLHVRLINRYCNFVLSRLLLSGFVVLSPPCHNTKV